MSMPQYKCVYIHTYVIRISACELKLLLSILRLVCWARSTFRLIICVGVYLRSALVKGPLIWPAYG